MRLPRPRAVLVLSFISAVAWVWSWYTMYLEIHRWKHVTGSLRFNPGPPIAGTTIRPRPGLPLKALYACSICAPTVLVGSIIAATASGLADHRGSTHGERSRAALLGDTVTNLAKR